tara:strand:- start:301 stop:1071 length:771 start_codon:yes stop_codon:yes gene_type:complete
MTNIYKKKLSQVHKCLNRKEQIDLFNKIKTGDVDARDTVIHSCLPLVINIAKKFRINNKHIDLEDMIQEGNIALMRAVDKWDIDKGSITTVATWYIKNSLVDMITDARYNIQYPYTLSRRAAEELRKIKNIDSTDIEYISQETGLTPKRVKKLLSISPRGMRRLNINGKSNSSFVTTLEEESVKKPCIGDLISLINTNLKGDQKTIFCLWAGINKKKIGPKEIAISLGKTEKYVYDNIYNAKRTLSRAAKKVNINA